MNLLFSTDFMKIVTFSALVTILFSLAGWQAGSIYYGLFTEGKPPSAPLYIFPAPKVNPLTTKKISTFEKKVVAEKKSIAQEKKLPLKKSVSLEEDKSLPPHIESFKTIKQKTTIATYPTMIRLIYSDKILNDDQFTDKLNPDLYSIQTGIFKKKINADKNFNYFVGQGYNPVMVVLDYNRQFKIYAVRIGKFKDMKTAGIAFLKFKEKEKKDAVLTTLYSTKSLIEICRKSF